MDIRDCRLRVEALVVKQPYRYTLLLHGRTVDGPSYQQDAAVDWTPSVRGVRSCGSAGLVPTYGLLLPAGKWSYARPMGFY